MNRTLASVLAAAAALAACAPASAPAPAPITDGESLIAAMHARYADTWYSTLRFDQRTTRIRPDGTEHVETWREWAAIPGYLRIEMGPPEERRGAIFANDSTYFVQNGTVARRTGDWNPLMTLGFDVYRQPPARTVEQLVRQGFRLAPLRRDAWAGRPAYVVGAAEGDLHSRQFWIDAERLVFLRMMEPLASDSARTVETRFLGYEPLGGGWIAPEVEVLVDGRRIFHEVYSDIRIDVPMDPALFDPSVPWS